MVVNTAKAVFNVDNYTGIFHSCDAAEHSTVIIYDTSGHDTKMLRGNSQEVAEL